MTEGDALDLIGEAIWMVMLGSGPAVAAAMVIGIVIALLQALTQIQEMTLTFVPKIVIVLVVSALTGPFVGAHLATFTDGLISRIESGF
ncbi:flagellar biosynthesis protein FliQ [Chthonobacter rhizosphaerae]|uniref:flagellar biosynthesis protein FliQ n=1 Tax=Chthonobacter rhizosphaerae TaxID=2735553 RepID=UPI0015EF5476